MYENRIDNLVKHLT